MNNHFNESFGLTNEKIYTSTAHGQMNIMGGFAEYFGSLVLQMPITEKVEVSIRKSEDNFLKIKFFSQDKLSECFISIHDITAIPNGDYESIKKLFDLEKWASSIFGCFMLLFWEQKIPISGFEIWVESNIPEDRGLGFFAALEVATLKVFSDFYHLNFEDSQLPILAQKVHHLMVDSLSSAKEQLTAFFGKSNHLLPIVCQPNILREPLLFPKDVYFMGIDSSESTDKTGNNFEKLKVASFMGYSILASLEGFDSKNIEQFQRSELPFGGYLSNIRVPDYNAKYSKIIPKTMIGKDFIKQYGNIFDSVISINPKEDYPILNATRHAIFENSRAFKFEKMFLNIEKTLSKKISYKFIGSYMDESNMSYSACGLGSEKINELVQMAYLARNSGVYGAKMTGDGFGGVVAILCVGEKGKEAVRGIWNRFQEKNGINVRLIE